MRDLIYSGFIGIDHVRTKIITSNTHRMSFYSLSKSNLMTTYPCGRMFKLVKEIKRRSQGF